MGETFARPSSGFRFEFGGTKTNSQPDALAPNKYPVTVNVRAITDSSLVTRPGQALRFTGALGSVAAALTDLRAYSRLSTDNLPRILARDNAPTANGIWLDNGVQIGVLADSATSSPGATLIPFRPAESPTPWMYIANGVDYQKFSAPSASNLVTQQKVGIAEPQTPPEACISSFKSIDLFTKTDTFVNHGTLGSLTPGMRVSDTAGVVLQDPVGGAPYVSSGNPYPIYSVQVAADKSYQRNQLLNFASPGNTSLVLDVFPGLATAVGISAIYLFASAGVGPSRAIIVPASIAPGPGNAGGMAASGGASGPSSQQASIYDPNFMSTLRRGSLIELNDGTICYVWSVTAGPDGTVCIETYINEDYVITPASFTILPAIQVSPTTGSTPPAAGQSIIGYALTGSASAGNAIFGIASPGYNPFVNPTLGISVQPDDYLAVGVIASDLTMITEIKVFLNVDAAADPTDGLGDYYYYSIRPSDIQAAVTGTATQLATAQTVSQRANIDAAIPQTADNQGKTATSAQLVPGSNQWVQILIPISSFTRVGSDSTKSLQTFTSTDIFFVCSGDVNVGIDTFAPIFGQEQVDVGDVGAPYQYRARPRSVVTGVKGNPSPATRYGVSPRRMEVAVVLPSAAYDPQIDTWDIERFGGTILSWRRIGTTPAVANAIFTDNFDDAAAEAGEPLDFDNFEPWPSVDLPLNATARVVDIVGTVALVAIPTPNNALRFLPGNLVQIGGANVYTLRRRPVIVNGFSGPLYRFEFEENAGFNGPVVNPALTLPVQIYEPAIANQPLPYMWGPDAAGTVFAAGDQLRPGTLYFSKGYAPDSAPDSYNIEITPPSEPLLGGATIDGLSLVASTERWWALYPQTGNASQRYAYIQQPFVRGLAAPYGVCDDGKTIYWWAKDGIYSSSGGSLTDGDLYDIFPHEGVVGASRTYNGVVVHAPDYSRTGTFRLAYKNSYLYATYQDSTGAYRTLVYDTRRSAWSVDTYSQAVNAFYAPEQQAGTLLSSTARYDELLMASVPSSGGARASISAQQADTNDLGGAIACIVARNEYDGGDIRAPKQWGDGFLDLHPAAVAGVSVTPMSLGVGVATPTVIPTAATRQRTPVSVGGIVVSDFLGVFLSWTDDFASQTAPTRLYVWQPSSVVQPARTIAWTTFGSSFGLDDYFHIRSMEFAYVSTAPITLTITTYDGQSPQVVTLPSTGGAYQKTFFPLTANKGQLYRFAASSSATFQIFFDDSDFHLGAWGRTTPYAQVKNFGGGAKDAAPI